MMGRMAAIDRYLTARAADLLLRLVCATGAHSAVLLTAIVFLFSAGGVIGSALSHAYILLLFPFLLLLMLRQSKRVPPVPEMLPPCYAALLFAAVSLGVRFFGGLVAPGGDWGDLTMAIDLIALPACDYLTRVPPIEPPRKRRALASVNV